MITSMTGFGRAEVQKNGYVAVVELRSVNNRFLEVSVRTPRSLSSREQAIRDLLRASIIRGSLNVSVKTEKDKLASGDLKVNVKAAKAYHKLLSDLRKAVKIKQEVTLRDLLQFQDVLRPDETGESDDAEWEVVKTALVKAAKELTAMRMREGKALEKDLRARIKGMRTAVGAIEKDADARIPLEREKLKARVAELVDDPKIIDERRLEFEIAMLSEKLDITEECVRFRSHLDVFDETLSGTEPAGRKMNFLVQEMNREVNTIGSKVNDAAIQHRVVGLKEEMERVREQLQNIE